MKVKICGLCRADDAAAAAGAGADYVGVILSAGRLRSVTLAESAAVFAAAGDAVQRVGVFVDASADEMVRAVEELALDVVQLHGEETQELVATLRRRVPSRIWKAVRVGTAADLAAATSRFGALVDGFLFDGGAGGSGTKFDWEAASVAWPAVPAVLTRIVAGGLTVRNVSHAVHALAPDVVDVSSGVEEAPRRKSVEAVRDFIAVARRAGDAVRG